MKQYLDALKFIVENGVTRADRTGTGTMGVFGMQMRFDLSKGFPAVTTKRLAWKAMTSELLWFIEGSGDERHLCELLHDTRSASKNTIWTGNASSPYWEEKAKFKGDLGRVYGVQWRHWRAFKENEGTSTNCGTPDGNIEEIDQLANLIAGIKKDPYGRRHILTAWNPGELDQMALPPCHLLAQFDVRDGKLNCLMYQRSCDMFLGVPFNIASYSLLTHMIAQVCDLEAGEFIWTGGDCHIYLNHIDQVSEQLQRTPCSLPSLSIDKSITDIDMFAMNSFSLVDYNPQASISAPMAV